MISAQTLKIANCFHPLKPCECKAKTILTIRNNESALYVIKQNTAHLLGFMKTVAEGKGYGWERGGEGGNQLFIVNLSSVFQSLSGFCSLAEIWKQGPSQINGSITHLQHLRS